MNLEQEAREFFAARPEILEVYPVSVGTEDELTYHARIAASFARQQVAERERQIADELVRLMSANLGNFLIRHVENFIARLRGEGE